LRDRDVVIRAESAPGMSGQHHRRGPPRGTTV